MIPRPALKVGLSCGSQICASRIIGEQRALICQCRRVFVCDVTNQLGTREDCTHATSLTGERVTQVPPQSGTNSVSEPVLKLYVS